MRVLFVTHRFPGAAFRGDQMRARAQIRELSQRHQISLLSFEQLPASHPALREMQALGVSVSMVARDRLAMVTRVLGAMPASKPLQVALFDSPSLRRRFKAELDSNLASFDVVHVQLVRLAGLLDAAAPIPVVVDFVDALSVNMASQAEGAPWLRSWVLRIESRRLARIEQAVLAKADGAVISSMPDAQALGASARLSVAPNGVDLDLFQPGPDAALRSHLVFHGNWAYPPNQTGLRWLLDEVLPLVWKVQPDQRFRLVGANIDRIAHELHDPRIDVIGEVESPVPALQSSAVSVAPLFAGSGQSLKILEAMACGTPVVTTTRAASAIAINGNCPCSIADSPSAFAQAILDLLGNIETRRDQANAARVFIESAFSWAHSNAVLESAWSHAASARGQ